MLNEALGVGQQEQPDGEGVAMRRALGQRETLRVEREVSQERERQALRMFYLDLHQLPWTVSSMRVGLISTPRAQPPNAGRECWPRK